MGYTYDDQNMFESAFVEYLKTNLIKSTRHLNVYRFPKMVYMFVMIIFIYFKWIHLLNLKYNYRNTTYNLKYSNNDDGYDYFFKLNFIIYWYF